MLVRVVHLCSKFVDGCKSTPISPPSSLARSPAHKYTMHGACQHSRYANAAYMYPCTKLLGLNTTLIYTLRTSHMNMHVYRSHCFKNIYLYNIYMCTCSDAHAECMYINHANRCLQLATKVFLGRDHVALNNYINLASVCLACSSFHT